jgi:hypothetical protein
MRILNFSGAPVMLLPRKAASQWHGILLRDPQSEGATPDFVDANGRNWYMRDEFDFDHPRSDYEFLCARSESAFLHDLGGVKAFVAGDGSDTWAWWDEERVLLSNLSSAPQRNALAKCSWEHLFAWQLDEPELLLLNSTLHGEDLADRSEWQEILLAPGRYTVEHAHLDAIGAYRFRISE